MDGTEQNKAPVVVVPLGTVGNLIPRVVAAHIQGYLNVPVDVSKGVDLPEDAYIGDRRQYDAGLLLKFLRSLYVDYPCVLGVVSVDICLPIFTYVFGEAELGGRAAVVSTYRLDRDVHGGPVPLSLFYERLAKVTLHEIGHVFSLYHCNHLRCLMQFSSRLESLDEIPLVFCDRCRFLLQRIMKRAERDEK
ncbi:archaemetzincin [Thermodesulforhabdus norvegica]|uniref:Archaemetzincin n=1 Tax=Thermodesulforhabdus norvegica TaxID=39841 RepID=A0A1I4SJD7_9BACT|nr:archaemetzincin [Thermodesulforhabdus norvegica]SFM64471.1 archaemetzincin [Thermodesulforhabdus norvegica]